MDKLEQLVPKCKQIKNAIDSCKQINMNRWHSLKRGCTEVDISCYSSSNIGLRQCDEDSEEPFHMRKKIDWIYIFILLSTIIFEITKILIYFRYEVTTLSIGNGAPLDGISRHVLNLDKLSQLNIWNDKVKDGQVTTFVLDPTKSKMSGFFTSFVHYNSVSLNFIQCSMYFHNYHRHLDT